MILIVGAKGNMGQRYARILDYLGVRWNGVDVEDGYATQMKLAEQSTGILIASPTVAHIPHLQRFVYTGKPILCEKPFSKSLDELRHTLDIFRRTKTPLSMVFQYSELVKPESRGPSWYNYFKTGGDGLIWDCIQIIALSRTPPKIEARSPIWDCTINGQQLSLGDMDMAYVKNVKRWLDGDYMSAERIYDAHVKTSQYEAASQGRHRDSGAQHLG